MYAPNGGPFSGLAGVSLALCMHLMEGLFLAFIRCQSCIVYAPNGGPFSGLHKAGVSLALHLYKHLMHLMEPFSGLHKAGVSLALCMHLMEGLFLAFIRQVSVLHCVCT